MSDFNVLTEEFVENEEAATQEGSVGPKSLSTERLNARRLIEIRQEQRFLEEKIKDYY